MGYWREIINGLPTEVKTEDGIGTNKSPEVLVVFSYTDNEEHKKSVRIAHYDYLRSKWVMPLGFRSDRGIDVGSNINAILWRPLHKQPSLTNKSEIFTGTVTDVSWCEKNCPEYKTCPNLFIEDGGRKELIADCSWSDTLHY
jgi:hypothetical protein